MPWSNSRHERVGRGREAGGGQNELVIINDTSVALRRSRRRRSSGGVAVHHRARTSSLPPSSARRRRTPGKRVRFSDPGPALLSTGLTPIFSRSSLETPLSGEVHFVPLRQVLDGRVKRRIRRNGLSEEMNNIYAERKRRADETKAEIERLKAELAEKDEEIERLQDQTVEIDSDRIWGLERQVAELKKELAAKSQNQRRQQRQQLPQEPTPDNSGLESWSSPSGDPFSTAFIELESQYDVDADDHHDGPEDDYEDVEEEDNEQFGEETLADLMSSTPTRSRTTHRTASFLSPPLTSPAPPESDALTPCSRRSRSRASQKQSTAPSTPTSTMHHQSVQTSPEETDNSTNQLQNKLITSLNAEIEKLTTTLESYSRLTSKFNPDQSLTSTATSPEDLETLLTDLTSQTAALSQLQSSISALGFSGSTSAEILSSIRSAFRSARLELEYLTPGEITLPLTNSGAAVLDLLIARLRQLGQLNKEKTDTIDEMRSVQSSLRSQLNARVDAMGILRKELEDRECTIQEMEDRVEGLRSGIEGHTKDIREAERVIKSLEAELEEEYEKGWEGKEKAEELETRLQVMSEENRALEVRVGELRGEIERLEGFNREEVEKKEKIMSELRFELETVGKELEVARQEVQRLRVENDGLERENKELEDENEEILRRFEKERVKSREVMEALSGLAGRIGEGLSESEDLPRRSRRNRRKRGVEEGEVGKPPEEEEMQVFSGLVFSPVHNGSTSNFSRICMDFSRPTEHIRVKGEMIMRN
ncbi:glycolipid 2-alpha-mannosyltransferase [Cladorrhinum sp. PSN259]|nr:glycolipid 2-alpha-mannosyltransferase [Cladorrhinum sp. PSN259]